MFKKKEPKTESSSSNSGVCVPKIQTAEGRKRGQAPLKKPKK